MNTQPSDVTGVGCPVEAAALRPMRTDWPTAALQCLARETAVVRVVVGAVRGSAPREPGACMLVTGSGIEGSIGGGHLEWRALHAARILLANDMRPRALVQRFTLGRDLSQCCGGVVKLWSERFTRIHAPILRGAAAAARSGMPAVLRTSLSRGSVTRALSTGVAPLNAILLDCREGMCTLQERLDSPRTDVWLYGAGHVGQALVRALADLPLHVTWVDPRAPLFPAPLPENVDVIAEPSAVDAVSRAPRTAYHIVMTHEHALDYAICSAVLRRDEFSWLGLIGSQSKSARFRSRLRRDGFSDERIARLVSPIGVTGIHSKLPAAIAIGVAAQLLQVTGATHVPEPRDAAANGGQHDCKAASCAACRP